MGGAGPSIAWEEGQFDPHFLTAPGGLLGLLESINDYLEKKNGQYLENWPKNCKFCWLRNFLKIFDNFIFQT